MCIIPFFSAAYSLSHLAQGLLIWYHMYSSVNSFVCGQNMHGMTFFRQRFSVLFKFHSSADQIDGTKRHCGDGSLLNYYIHSKQANLLVKPCVKRSKLRYDNDCIVKMLLLIRMIFLKTKRSEFKQFSKLI